MSDAARVGGGDRPHWPAAAIREAVAPFAPALTVEVLPQVDSTNTELMRRARAGRYQATLLVGERQTAGRGRLGRSWDSEPGKSLTFSLGLPLAPADWSGLSLAVGVTLAECLDPRIRLKWPNDLWLDDRKLGGVLIETAAGRLQDRYAVIGVGINLARPASSGLATAPASLDELLPGCEPGTVLLRVAPPLVAAVQRFEREGFRAFKGRFEARDALKGRAIALSDGTAGAAQGITDQGALRVQTERGIATVSSSEVSVRPRH